MKTTRIVMAAFLFWLTLPATASQIPHLEARFRQAGGVWNSQFAFGDRVVASDSSGLEIMSPGDGSFHPVTFHVKHGSILGPTQLGPLSVKLEVAAVGPNLIRRTLIVTAKQPAKFAARWSLDVAVDGTYTTFSSEEKSRVVCDSLGGGPEYPEVRGETFPAAMVRTSDTVFGVLADSPGKWENRCLMELDPVAKRLAVMCGDGRDARELKIKFDARDTYSGMIDGWQSLAAGETRRYDTWVFAGPARSHYDAQLTAHLALANAKGWNTSALEAILRNTAYLNLRRNLLRVGKGEGQYIFISGIGYGWKQWVSDGFWQAVALGDKKMIAEAQQSVFINRITYEDNAQYYLIWAALAKRGGGKPNATIVRQAYDFIRKNEVNGIFIPPPLPGSSKPKGFKTYHDLLEYEDGDAPVSDQAFHCGALMAAKELGLPVTQAEIDRAIAGYRGMFFAKGGYFPTSVQQTNHVGQDVFYGAALTYAVFGQKLLEDGQVLTHWRTSQRIRSPYGLRVISNADGSLLAGHSGEYVFGGSWFLNDSANHLMAGLHGLPSTEMDAALIKRIGLELAFIPAFNESISTVTGKPHGHINYSWNSGYWWLRKEFRRRLGVTGVDPVEVEIDRQLGVVRDGKWLGLVPERATLRPGSSQ